MKICWTNRARERGSCPSGKYEHEHETWKSCFEVTRTRYFRESGEESMKGFFLMGLFLLAVAAPLCAAETLDQLIAGAKKESEFTFIAGAQTFGGAKTLSALEPAF